MTPDSTTFDDHNPLAEAILGVLKGFVDEIAQREAIGHFEDVVDGPKFLKGRDLTQEPERFVEDHLVFPMLTEAFGHDIRPRPKQYAPRWPKSGVPDFCLTSLPVSAAKQHDVRIFGEVKPPKKIGYAREEMKEYLESDLNVNAVAILTDGFDWELWVRPQGRELETLDNPYTKASLRNPLRTVRTENFENEEYGAHNVREKIEADQFAGFMPISIQEVLREEFGTHLTLTPRQKVRTDWFR